MHDILQLSHFLLEAPVGQLESLEVFLPCCVGAGVPLHFFAHENFLRSVQYDLFRHNWQFYVQYPRFNAPSLFTSAVVLSREPLAETFVTLYLPALCSQDFLQYGLQAAYQRFDSKLYMIGIFARKTFDLNQKLYYAQNHLGFPSSRNRI